jgi:anti-sigma-28 factor FlgM
MDEIPVVHYARAADENGTDTRAKVTNLKRDIESNRYDVDAPAVADAMLRKIRVLKQGGRLRPISEAGRSRPDPEDPRAR